MSGTGEEIKREPGGPGGGGAGLGLISAASRERRVTWAEVYRRNKIEELKRDRFPLDVVEELPRFIEMGYEAIPEEDIVRLNWWGFTHDKPKVGYFMARIKVPGGRLSPAQLRAVGEISRTLGRNYGELTTRQALQLHWIHLEKLPQVLEQVKAAGLTTVGGEGDTVRNISSCPLGGVNPAEPFDPYPVIREVASFFDGHRHYSNLPRKLKVSVSSCPHQCEGPEIQDIALLGVRREGREGFAVRVGGGLSIAPRISLDLGVFVPREEALEVLRALIDLWNEDLRYRLSRAKARFKFFVEDHGPDRVREMLEEELGRRLPRLAAPSPLDFTDHLEPGPQKQEGLWHLGFPVPVGQVSGTQMIEIADLAEEVGAEIRLTRQQNFILVNVPEDKLPRVEERLREIGFPRDRNRIWASSVACTGYQFCNYPVAETKEKLREILEAVEAAYGREAEGLRICMDGCPHACALHWVGDIGLMGTATRSPSGLKVEAYDLTLRGSQGGKAAVGRPLIRRLPTEETTQAVLRLVGAWIREKELRGPVSFPEFCRRRTDEELLAIALGEVVEEEEAAAGVTVRVPGSMADLTGGLDHLEVQARTVREALEAVGKLYPAFLQQVITPEGEVDSYVNVYVNEEDIRSLRGLDTEVKPGDEIILLPAMAGG